MFEIYNSNCLIKMDELILNGIRVDLTVTSPPYDNLRSYNGNNELWNENVWKGILDRLYKITKEGGVVVWVVSDSTINGSETGSSFKQALYAKEIGFNLHDTMIYLKENWIPLTHNRYEQQFEYMFVFSKGKPKTFNPLTMDSIHSGKDITRSKDNGDENKSFRGRKVKSKTNSKKRKPNVWLYKIGTNCTTKDKIAFKHPAIFPESLANDHILSWSDEGDIVFDPMMGSGTTGKMAILNNRNFIGIELEKQYFDIAKERLESLTHL